MGPYYFAWVNANDSTFSESHKRLDEQVLSFNLSHNEGDFPSLDITIINPQVGLLASGRKVWAWLSYDKNWTPPPIDEDSSEGGSESGSEEPDIVPLFFGRLLGVPEDLQAEQVQLAFIARPENFAAQKAAVADALKVRPYWDGIWFSPDTRDDPDNALESRPELWHIDRLTLAVTSSNILTGEDGLLAFGEDEIFYDTMHLSRGQPPLRRVDVTASVSWDQNAAGVLDVSEFLNFGSPHSILTFTALDSTWPKPGANMNGGWKVVEGSAERVDGIGGAIWGYGLRNVPGATAGGTSPFGRTYRASDDFHDAIVPAWAVAYTFSLSGGGSGLSQDFPAHILGLPRMRYIPTLKIGYDVSRKRSEQLTFSLEADVQAVQTEPGDEDSLRLSFSSSEIAAAVDPVEPSSESESEPPSFTIPLGDVKSSVYFSTERGAQSVEYLIALARSRLLARARCVSIEFEIPFTLGVESELSCRKSVVMEDYRLPGGIVSGKIKSYTLSSNGETGVQTCQVNIGCSVGKGNTVTAVEGEPTYVEAGYVERGYQRYEGAYVMPIAGEVAYGDISGLASNDDGVDFYHLTPGRVVISVEKTNHYLTQAAAMGDSADEPNDIFSRLNDVPTTFRMTLLPVTGGPFETVFDIPTSGLMVPKTIDLEAGS